MTKRSTVAALVVALSLGLTPAHAALAQPKAASAGEQKARLEKEKLERERRQKESSIRKTPAGIRAATAPAAPPPGQAPAPAAETNGAILYARNCAGCHGQGMRGKSAAQTQIAINSNVGGMGHLKRLTPAQVEAIAGY